MTGMGGQSGIHNLGDVGRGLQQLGDGHGVALVLSHAHMQGLQSSVGHVAVKGSRDATRGWEKDTITNYNQLQ